MNSTQSWYRGFADDPTIRTVIETGTGAGVETRALAGVFPKVHTIELNAMRLIESAHLGELDNVHRYCGPSLLHLEQLIPRAYGRILFHLDASNFGPLPLRDELRLIAAEKPHAPVVLIRRRNLFPPDGLSHSEVWSYPMEQFPSAAEVQDLLKEVYPDGSTICFDETHQAMVVTPSKRPAPEGLHLLTSFRLPEATTTRDEEYVSALMGNLENPNLGSVTVLSEDFRKTIRHPKLRIVPTVTRVTIQNLIDYANNHLSGGRCVICNADILFNSTLSETPKDMDNRLINLTRWEIKQGEPTFSNNPYSQDAWIFQSPYPVKDAHCFLGVPGCDNLLSWLTQKAGMKRENWGKTIVAQHIHGSESRLVHNYFDRVVRHYQPSFLSTQTPPNES